MKLKDLKQGMVCKLRNGSLITILVYGDYHKSNFARIHSLYDYNDDLTHKKDKLSDIMEITYGDKIVFERKESNRWFVPEDGEYYYSINEYGNIEPHKNVKDSFDNETVFKNVRVFKTQEEAEKRLRQQQATLSVEKWIAENDVEVDVLDEDVIKFYFTYDVETENFVVSSSNYRIIIPKQFILSSEEKVKQLIKEREKELKIMFGVEK